MKISLTEVLLERWNPSTGSNLAAGDVTGNFPSRFAKFDFEDLLEKIETFKKSTAYFFNLSSQKEFFCIQLVRKSNCELK